jgi:hypothetical protein
MAVIGSDWPSLVVIGRHWQSLTVIGRRWPSLAVHWPAGAPTAPTVPLPVTRVAEIQHGHRASKRRLDT